MAHDEFCDQNFQRTRLKCWRPPLVWNSESVARPGRWIWKQPCSSALPRACRPDWSPGQCSGPRQHTHQIFCSDASFQTPPMHAMQGVERSAPGAGQVSRAPQPGHSGHVPSQRCAPSRLAKNILACHGTDLGWPWEPKPYSASHPIRACDGHIPSTGAPRLPAEQARVIATGSRRGGAGSRPCLLRPCSWAPVPAWPSPK